MFNPSVTYGTLTDQDGNTYKTVTIGTQIWIAENLRTTKYNDGTAIPLVTDNTAWKNLTTSAYCNSNNTTNIDTIATFGRLYNWYAVNTDKLAPVGWHVPTYEEWITLITYLDGESVAGGKLKETGTTHWLSPNTGASNTTGFTALPSIQRYVNGVFSTIAYDGKWWNATEYNTDIARYHILDYTVGDISRNSSFKQLGLSIRCVRD